MRTFRTLAAAFLLAGGTALLPAQDAADKTNPTADKAKDNKSDRELMQKIRKAIVDDKSLSTSAHNAKVIARNGRITLKGPVRSAEEKTAIVSKATEIAGAGNVTDELTVKAEKADRKKKESKQS